MSPEPPNPTVRLYQDAGVQQTPEDVSQFPPELTAPYSKLSHPEQSLNQWRGESQARGNGHKQKPEKFCLKQTFEGYFAVWLIKHWHLDSPCPSRYSKLRWSQLWAACSEWRVERGDFQRSPPTSIPLKYFKILWLANIRKNFYSSASAETVLPTDVSSDFSKQCIDCEPTKPNSS